MRRLCREWRAADGVRDRRIHQPRRRAWRDRGSPRRLDGHNQQRGWRWSRGHERQRRRAVDGGPSCAGEPVGRLRRICDWRHPNQWRQVRIPGDWVHSRRPSAGRRRQRRHVRFFVFGRHHQQQDGRCWRDRREQQRGGSGTRGRVHVCTGCRYGGRLRPWRRHGTVRAERPYL